jgi:hypothetical protein
MKSHHSSSRRCPMRVARPIHPRRSVLVSQPDDAKTGPVAHLGMRLASRMRSNSVLYWVQWCGPSSPSAAVSTPDVLRSVRVTCTISLQLNNGTAPVGVGPGEDARGSNAETPKNVTMTFAASGLNALEQSELPCSSAAKMLSAVMERLNYIRASADTGAFWCSRDRRVPQTVAAARGSAGRITQGTGPPELINRASPVRRTI